MSVKLKFGAVLWLVCLSVRMLYAQQYGVLSLTNYQEYAKVETANMKKSYHLSARQEKEALNANQTYYQGVAQVMSHREDITIMRGKTQKVEATRDAELQKIFTKDQFTAYRNYIDQRNRKYGQPIVVKAPVKS